MIGRGQRVIGAATHYVENQPPWRRDVDEFALNAPLVDAVDAFCEHIAFSTQQVERVFRRARELGKQVMVGNMCGTSLAAAPAFVLGQFCDVVDLDGPVFLKQDRSPSVRYEDGHITCGDEVWGPGTVP